MIPSRYTFLALGVAFCDPSAQGCGASAARADFFSGDFFYADQRIVR